MLCDADGRREGLMTPYIPPLEEPQFAHAGASRTSLSEVIFRIVRWSTYAGAILTLILVLHKTPPPPIETSPQAAARGLVSIGGGGVLWSTRISERIAPRSEA